MARHPYAFIKAFQMAVIEALGLKGRHVRKLTLEMEVGKPVTLTVEEFPSFEDTGLVLPDNFITVLELADFQSKPQPTTSTLTTT